MGRGVPDRWLDYQAVGNVIAHSRILSFKVPLKKALCDNLDARDIFSPALLLEMLEKRDLKLGLVIDLTNTDRYYQPREFESHGIGHVKIRTEGHAVPKSDICLQFNDAVDEFLRNSANDGKMIGVHCTHGVNRTGYLVCRYLIQRQNQKPDEAVKAFNEARGYSIERTNYLQHLEQLPSLTSSDMEAIDALAQQLDKKSGVKLHFNHSPQRSRGGGPIRDRTQGPWRRAPHVEQAAGNGSHAPYSWREHQPPMGPRNYAPQHAWPPMQQTEQRALDSWAPHAHHGHWAASNAGQGHWAASNAGQGHWAASNAGQGHWATDPAARDPRQGHWASDSSSGAARGQWASKPPQHWGPTPPCNTGYGYSEQSNHAAASYESWRK